MAVPQGHGLAATLQSRLSPSARPLSPTAAAWLVREIAARTHKVKDIQEADGVDEADYYKWLNGTKPDHYCTRVAIEGATRMTSTQVFGAWVVRCRRIFSARRTLPSSDVAVTLPTVDSFTPARQTLQKQTIRLPIRLPGEPGWTLN